MRDLKSKLKRAGGVYTVQDDDMQYSFEVRTTLESGWDAQQWSARMEFHSFRGTESDAVAAITQDVRQFLLLCDLDEELAEKRIALVEGEVHRLRKALEAWQEWDHLEGPLKRGRARDLTKAALGE